MITTTAFTMTRPTYLKINAMNIYSRGRPVAIILAVYTLVSLLGLFVSQDGVFVVYLAVGWLLVGGVAFILMLATLRIARHRDNQLYFQERTVEIDEAFIVTRYHDGTELRHRLDNVTKVRDFADGYVLFVASNAFLYIARDALQSASDRAAFEALLRERGLL